MIVAIIFQLLFVSLVIFGIYRVFARGTRRGTGEFSIRRLFQYVLLYLSLVISGVGVSGLLGRTLDTGRVIAESRTDLARNLSFTIVGLPLLYGFARWTARVRTSNPSESRSFSFNAYLTVASLTSLAFALFGLHDFLGWAIGAETYRGNALAQFLIWTLIWFGHWRFMSRATHENEREPQILIGSGIGLVILTVGLGGLVGNVIERLINYQDVVTVLQRTDPVTNSLITILVGLPVWYFYWLRNALHATRDLIWNAYVLLAGIAVSFVTAVVSVSIIGYNILVWFFGDTKNASATEHFFGTANAIGSAAITLAIWWYHRLILHPTHTEMGVVARRSELRRVYEYIIAGISLIAAALGILMIIVAAIESVTPGEIAAASGSTNSLILAITLLIVGAPLWWYFWHRIEGHALTGDDEIASPTRRIFLLMLFGVAGVAAVISVITMVFLFFDDLLNGELSRETLRSARFAIGILLTNGAIAGYHWSIYRNERTVSVQGWGKARKIVLVGPADGEVAKQIRSRIGGEIEMWQTPAAGTWDLEELIELIESNPSSALLVINEKSKLRALEIRH